MRWSKTVQLGQRTILIPLVARPQSVLCPIAAVSQALSLTPEATSNTQVFFYRSSTSVTLSVFTYKTFMSSMKQILVELGIPPHRYGTHSFRQGGACFALEAGVPLDVISLMGDWKSDAMYLYLHMPVSQRISAQRVITSHLP